MIYSDIIKNFLALYPKGFEDEKWKEGEKKHKVEKINSFVDLNFSKEKFNEYIYSKQQGKIIDLIVRLTNLSSMVSTFEKIALRNFVIEANNNLIDEFALLINKFLYGNNFNEDFSNFCDFLLENKDLGKNTNIAKWPFVTSLLAHTKRDTEIFIKPTSLKLISLKLDKKINYNPKPNIDTYNEYKKIILEFKDELKKIIIPKDNIITQAVLYVCCEAK